MSIPNPDGWISRGHERLDDESEQPHPLEQHEDECVCAHGLTVGEFCIHCQVDAEMRLPSMFAKVLARIQECEDEQLGAALSRKFEGRKQP